MPARKEEVESAKEEGVRFRFLTSPVRFIGDERGRVVAMECIEMGLGQPDRRGRREPIPKRGTEFQMPVDTVVMALGYQSDPLVLNTTQRLQSNSHGGIAADTSTGRTQRPGVWCGGDVVTGAATVVRAMVAGRRAAADIDAYLRGNHGGKE